MSHLSCVLDPLVTSSWADRSFEKSSAVVGNIVLDVRSKKKTVGGIKPLLSAFNKRLTSVVRLRKRKLLKNR